jgi:hypothetical protein
MYLKDVSLCLDCESIDLTATHCLLCGSKMVVPLKRWIPPMNECGPSDEVSGRREALFRECRDMAERMMVMGAEVGIDEH